MATIAAIVDYNLPANAAEDSHNFLPLLHGKSEYEGIREAHIHNTKTDHYAIRKGEWVLIDAKSGGVSKVPEWFNKKNGYEPNSYNEALYNLHEDIAQRKNLAAEYPEKVTELRALLQQIRKQGHSAPRLAGKRNINYK